MILGYLVYGLCYYVDYFVGLLFGFSRDFLVLL